MNKNNRKIPEEEIKKERNRLMRLYSGCVHQKELTEKGVEKFISNFKKQ